MEMAVLIDLPGGLVERQRGVERGQRVTMGLKDRRFFTGAIRGRKRVADHVIDAGSVLVIDLLVHGVPLI
jgi:hypothetical protein